MVGQEIEVISTFCRELGFGYLNIFVCVLLTQILTTKDPAIAVFGVSGKTDTCVIIEWLLYSIDKTASKFQPLHTR